MDEKQKGIVFNIQRYSIHDGPGIRTVIFLKGCPMKCLWCENPESINPKPQLAFFRNNCINCNSCSRVCPNGAIDTSKNMAVDWQRCKNCGLCVGECPSEALKIIGEEKTVKEVVDLVLRDKKYYETSNGGVTISGGEATFQFDYFLNLLIALKGAGLQVVLETNGFLAWDKLYQLLNLVDIFYYDLKAIDGKLHEKLTGVNNRQILDNAQKLVKTTAKVVFRIPLISKINVNLEALESLFNFLDDIDAKEIHLLPYHRLGEGKLESMNTQQKPIGIKEMSEEELQVVKKCLMGSNRKVLIGGD